MQSMKKNFKKFDKQAYEKVRGWIKRKWKWLLFLTEIAILIFAGISYYRHVNNLICYEYPEEQLMQYTDEMYSSCFGGAIDESYSAGLYNVIPEQEMLLRKGYYRYTLSYESTSEGSFCWPHSYNTFYNVMDEAVIYFENGVHETEEEFWLNVDLNVALRLSYNGTGTVKLTGFTIEETPVAANIRLFAVVIFLFGLDVILGLWIYNKKHVISAERRYVFAALLTISLVASEFISNINSDENAVMRELYLSTSAVQQAVIAQDKVIKKIAESGSCVIVGRSADYVLRNQEKLIRIFIYAPKEYRTRKVMEMYGDTWDEGKKNIERSDTARATYYKNISGKKWGDPHQYELCIDSSIGTQECADAIVEYISKRNKQVS